MVEDSFIDTRIVSAALNYYSKLFEPISVPMCTDYESINTTIKEKNVTEHLKHFSGKSMNCDYYVGSAEQSFIYMYNNKQLPFGSYMAITPCERLRDNHSNIHFPVFLKIELITIGKITNIIDIASSFFDKYVSGIDIIESGNRPGELDIILNDIEIGSYGNFKFNDGVPYSYGTGLAEPRFTYARGLK